MTFIFLTLPLNLLIWVWVWVWPIKNLHGKSGDNLKVNRFFTLFSLTFCLVSISFFPLHARTPRSKRVNYISPAQLLSTSRTSEFSQVLVRAISSNRRTTELFGVLSETWFAYLFFLCFMQFSFISRFLMGQQIANTCLCTRLSSLGSAFF